MKNKQRLQLNIRRVLLGRRGLAIPVSFFILFVSLLMVISATYYFAVARVNSKSKQFNVLAAEQNILLLEDSISDVSWSVDASEIYEFDDCGGILKVKPNSAKLKINVVYGNSSDKIFDGFIGEVRYELYPAEYINVGSFLKGDSRVVVNKSGSELARLFITNTNGKAEIVLHYRPLVLAISDGYENGKPVNYIRVYVINLNSSQNMELQGEIPLKISCLNVYSEFYVYNFSQPISNLFIQVAIGSDENSVSVPLESNQNGAIANLEVLVCRIRIEKLSR